MAGGAPEARHGFNGRAWWERMDWIPQTTPAICFYLLQLAGSSRAQPASWIHVRALLQFQHRVSKCFAVSHAYMLDLDFNRSGLAHQKDGACRNAWLRVTGSRQPNTPTQQASTTRHGAGNTQQRMQVVTATQRTADAWIAYVCRQVARTALRRFAPLKG